MMPRKRLPPQDRAEGPFSGWPSDRYGSRGLATTGMLVLAAGFILLAELPANFSYLPFMLILVLVGIGMGLFGFLYMIDAAA